MSENSEEHPGWKAKYILQVIGGSILLLPHAMGQVGCITFIVILVVEAYCIGNSLIMFRKMAPKEGIEYANYFTIVSQYLGGSCNTWYNVICVLFIFDVLTCASFYLKILQEVNISTFFADATPVVRSAYSFRIHVLAALFLIIVEYVSERIQRQDKDPGGNVNIIQNISNCFLNKVDLNEDGASAVKSNTAGRNKINMLAVVERLHGYNWKRLFLLVLFLFLSVSVHLLFMNLPSASDIASFNTTKTCPGLQKPPYFALPSLKGIVAVPIIIFSLMHYAVFLPICLQELRLEIRLYSKAVKISSLTFAFIYSFVAWHVCRYLGTSTPVLFITAFGSNDHGLNISILTTCFVLVAMLLRIMGCCRLIQVLFKCESDSYYWIIATLLFVICFYICAITPSVVFLVCIAGSFSCNLLIIILPRIAYLNFLRSVKVENAILNPTSGHRQNLTTAEQNRSWGEAISDLWHRTEFFQTLFCISIHMIFLPMTILEIMVADPTVGEKCRYIFDKLLQ